MQKAYRKDKSVLIPKLLRSKEVPLENVFRTLGTGYLQGLAASMNTYQMEAIKSNGGLKADDPSQSRVRSGLESGRTLKLLLEPLGMCLLTRSRAD